jgi:dipeptidyl aminopeptidase/acylaminoacyl peptidase
MAGMAPRDVYQLTGVSDPRVSPDGRTIAYEVWSIDEGSNRYRAAIWLVAADGSSPPRQLTAGVKRDERPRWSPDGSHIAFVSDREKDEGQLYVIAVAGGEPRKLTDVKASVEDLAWSPDGGAIVFESRVPDAAYDEKDEKKREPRRFTRLQFKFDTEGWIGDRPKHLWTVASDGSGPARQLTEGDFEDHGLSWSPDGSRIAFSSARHKDWDLTYETHLFVVDAAGGEPRQVTSKPASRAAPSWSPDGGRLAYLHYKGVMDDPRHIQVAVLDLGTGIETVLTESLDRNCGPYPQIREPIWDGEDLIFAVEDQGNNHVYRVKADGSGKPQLVLGGDLWVSGYDSAGGTLAYVASKPDTLAELFVGDRKVTDIGKKFVSSHELIAPERFVAVSPDGTEVEAWVMRPTGFEEGQKYPTLLNIHGGPFTQYGNKFFDEFQVYVGAGYAVVYSNPRGSSGYSEEWGRTIRGPGEAGPGWGSVDYEDLMAVTDEAVKRFDFIDPDRLGVIGGSYGGFMTSWIAGHTDRFQAAVSERAVNQWISMWGASDSGWDFKGYVGKYLFEDPDAWVKMSPSTYATQITTPLLILHSENDLRCPIEQAEQLFTTLRVLKREVEFVRFPAESHELTRSGNPGHRRRRFEIVLEWFDRHLKRT